MKVKIKTKEDAEEFVKEYLQKGISVRFKIGADVILELGNVNDSIYYYRYIITRIDGMNIDSGRISAIDTLILYIYRYKASINRYGFLSWVAYFPQ